MKISIVIPVYNSSSTLKECLDSIFSSTFKDYEVIVVSGNSTDDSIKIARQFQIKIIELPELIESRPKDRIDILFQYSKLKDSRKVKVIGFGKWKDYKFDKI